MQISVGEDRGGEAEKRTGRSIAGGAAREVSTRSQNEDAQLRIGPIRSRYMRKGSTNPPMFGFLPSAQQCFSAPPPAHLLNVSAHARK